MIGDCAPAILFSDSVPDLPGVWDHGRGTHPVWRAILFVLAANGPTRVECLGDRATGWSDEERERGLHALVAAGLVTVDAAVCRLTQTTTESAAYRRALATSTTI